MVKHAFGSPLPDQHVTLAGNQLHARVEGPRICSSAPSPSAASASVAVEDRSRACRWLAYPTCRNYRFGSRVSSPASMAVAASSAATAAALRGRTLAQRLGEP